MTNIARICGLLVALTIVTTPITHAMACRCALAQTPSEAFAESMMVFVGTVIAVEPITDTPPEPRRRVRFVVA